MRVIVHGGAGGGPDDPDARRETLGDAAATGAAESTPLDAVEAALRPLESDPKFNAGVGGAVQSDGVARTDAGAMTDGREVGAAAGMPGVEHAVSAARAVLEETPHVLVAGVHAVDLAADYGVETGVELTTPETRRRYADAAPPDRRDAPDEHLAWVRDRFGGTDTVGAVAADGESVAAATSTAGRWFALAGRVGDVPQVGSGFYCAPAGGASATGAGEDIARTTLSRRAVAALEDGLDADAAAERAVAEFEALTGSEAGVVVLDADGDAGSAFCSEAMQTAVARR